jgi:MOSC domain-containing protein YiiM
MARFPREGRVEFVGVRPARGTHVQAVDAVQATAGRGLTGDRYSSASGKRGVTLIQAEHLPVIAGLAGLESIDPSSLRRNLVVRGIPLLALKGRTFRVGGVLLEGTGPCDPCSKMEAVLGEGGYNAMRGHGGLCARIVEGGIIRLGDPVCAVD